MPREKAYKWLDIVRTQRPTDEALENVYEIADDAVHIIEDLLAELDRMEKRESELFAILNGIGVGLYGEGESFDMIYGNLKSAQDRITALERLLEETNRAACAKIIALERERDEATMKERSDIVEYMKAQGTIEVGAGESMPFITADDIILIANGNYRDGLRRHKGKE